VSVVELSWLQTGVLLLTPAIVLAIALFFGRYPGEELLVRRARPPRRSRRRRTPRQVWVTPSRRVAGGLLLGHSLAGRAPPPERLCDSC